MSLQNKISEFIDINILPLIEGEDVIKLEITNTLQVTSEIQFDSVNNKITMSFGMRESDFIEHFELIGFHFRYVTCNNNSYIYALIRK